MKIGRIVKIYFGRHRVTHLYFGRRPILVPIIHSGVMMDSAVHANTLATTQGLVSSIELMTSLSEMSASTTSAAPAASVGMLANDNAYPAGNDAVPNTSINVLGTSELSSAVIQVVYDALHSDSPVSTLTSATLSTVGAIDAADLARASVVGQVVSVVAQDSSRTLINSSVGAQLIDIVQKALSGSLATGYISSISTEIRSSNSVTELLNGVTSGVLTSVCLRDAFNTLTSTHVASRILSVLTSDSFNASVSAKAAAQLLSIFTASSATPLTSGHLVPKLTELIREDSVNTLAGSTMSPSTLAGLVTADVNNSMAHDTAHASLIEPILDESTTSLSSSNASAGHTDTQRTDVILSALAGCLQVTPLPASSGDKATAQIGSGTVSPTLLHTSPSALESQLVDSAEMRSALTTTTSNVSAASSLITSEFASEIEDGPWVSVIIEEGERILLIRRAYEIIGPQGPVIDLR